MSPKMLLMNPGPIAFESEVLTAFAHEGISHVDPAFLEVFGQCLEQMRHIFLADDGQPLVVAGSGTLGWDMVGANLIEAGDNALVINTGYFGDSFGTCLERYGATVTHVRAPVGSRPSIDELKAALAATSYKVITITHVDTSTGVLSCAAEYTAAIRAAQPNAIVVLDGVCSLGGEELRMKAWDIDVVLTGSQKCIGVPAGLSLLMLRPRAIKAFEAIGYAKGAYYVDWAHWLPIMKNYEARRPSYFATPAVNHFYALQKGFEILLANGGIEQRFIEQRNMSLAIKGAIKALGCGFVPASDCAANTLTCVRYPKGVAGPDFLPKVTARGVSLAGGLHKDIKMEYFRIGHMGQSTRIMEHAIRTINAIEAALIECGHAVPTKGQAAGVTKSALKATLPMTKAGHWHFSPCCGGGRKCPVPVKCQLWTIGLVVAAFGAGVALASRRK
ncbi:hypothetical protein SDRG_10799 [Saprolegnia diclina VS20]|uniref:alanine--glyoxylate transaminase n=1 Tax=Saprolegnia diclina (strain VS20) TaxID=1156394 RepID=T0Q1B9_SAPDV|nr:hypothetical protein SDRG_10799 [Saprolegnia diclina VS20]EQC31634.1 hypothetical protein SDRG_10799 [Saprolegnia diclina VS20]|eukprot:XP_008615033.1 hypothetical protein SDRG_10799 [Saprolegnia diclina VS20]